MFDSWDKVHRFLDLMDISDLHSSLPCSSTSSFSSASSDSNQHPLGISTRNWLVGEQTTRKILSVIQPTIDSETRRKEIIEYLQRLIADAFGIKVFPFGSVPFKTYLPHGDIDLTTLSQFATNHDLAAEICQLLENEEKNNYSASVRDVLCVPAQVRVVKCTVGDIAVDISFNQIAGLCALYFLEQVDQFIGKDHLFKLSVILIKAWCYYESRILGGFHGLISTYALETMVLHVINLFHSSLHSPLAVLYKFLDYYSTFDWRKYCIGINGLIVISSLPQIEVASLHNCDELLLSEEFLRKTREALLPSTGVVGAKTPYFPIKFLNILDPLRDDNNLGRCVSKGNFYRIKSALSFGAQRMREILILPLEKIGIGLEKFFNNTLERNGKGNRVDVLVPVPRYGLENPANKNENNKILDGIQYGLSFDVQCPTSTTFHGCNNGRVEWGPVIQYDQNAYYDMEESPPSSLDSPRGLGPNNFASNGEKWKPRRATSSVDYPRTTQLNNGGSYEEKWQPPGFRLSVNWLSGFSSNHDAYAEEKWKSRGTCAFIPSFEHQMPVNLTFEQNVMVLENEIGKEFHQDTEKGKEFHQYAENVDLLDSTSSDVGENSSSVNYSMDEFPALPGSKPIPIRASSLDYVKCEPVICPSPSLDSTESLSEAGKQSDSDGSIFLDALSDPIGSMEVLDEYKNSSKSEENMEDVVQPLQLTDEIEFPPLGLPEKPVTLCKKEFPPLRACLKLLKKNKGKNGVMYK